MLSFSFSSLMLHTSKLHGLSLVSLSSLLTQVSLPSTEKPRLSTSFDDFHSFNGESTNCAHVNPEFRSTKSYVSPTGWISTSLQLICSSGWTWNYINRFQMS